jgi:D-sedoheptulose 7-phosphate isomerase
MGKTYWVDLDNTLCKTEGNNYYNSIPDKERIAMVNQLYDLGEHIVIWTSRGTVSNKDWEELTRKQLSTWCVKYHSLRVSEKPDFLIDDIAILPEQFFNDWQDENVELLATEIEKLTHNGGKVLVAGNGGLAAESSHFVAELVGKYAFDVYIPAIALSENTSIVTAISNDMGYENVFSHQVKVLGRPNDIFIGMTGSKSPNILKALSEARKKGLVTVAICSPNYFKFDADYIIVIDGQDAPEVQENILKFLHKLAYKAKEKVVNNVG